MTQINIKRVYEPAQSSDGFRVLVDKMWPRGVKKEALPYDLWAKEITPSTPLRQWFHADPQNRWIQFRERYLQELSSSQSVRKFIGQIRGEATVTLLYASKSATENHALILQEYLRRNLE